MKKIDSYFSKISREQIETDALISDQASRKRREEKAAATAADAAADAAAAVLCHRWSRLSEDRRDEDSD